MELDSFFTDRPDSRQVFDLVYEAACTSGPLGLRVSKSQIALVAGRPFAWVWIPGRYLRGATPPLVLTCSFGEPRPWSRWKEIYQAAPRHFTHHLELWSPLEVNDEVRDWLQVARQVALEPRPRQRVKPDPD